MRRVYTKETDENHKTIPYSHQIPYRAVRLGDGRRGHSGRETNVHRAAAAHSVTFRLKCGSKLY